EVPAVSRARRDPEGAADGEPRAGSADGVGAVEPGLGSRLVEEAVRHPAGDADARVLARLPEVVLPAPRWQRRAADSRDSRLSADVPRRAEPEGERGENSERQLANGEIGEVVKWRIGDSLHHFTNSPNSPTG